MHVITGGSGSGKSAYAEMWLTGKPEKSEEKKAICPYLYICLLYTSASFVVSKKEDPAVLVIDELGKYCIPILSGHIGGANELAEKLSQMLSMEAVITTATDLNQKWAVDIFAKKNRLYIEDMKLAKLVSADILAGKQVLAEIEPECSVIGQIPKELKFIHESDRCDSRALKIHIGICKNDTPAGSGTQVLYLIPKAVVLGIGCKDVYKRQVWE